MTKEEIIQKIRIVDVSQNSWEEENLLLLTTLDDKQIQDVFKPLIDEEKANGEVCYSNEDMVSILQEKYPSDIVIYYKESDYLEIY